eukprot:maker-scaffold_15-snap-gene-4.2-mRNA-1 protein AED:0.07 eAED:0.17 QI:0/0/0.33/1/0/0/3/1099/74
MNFVAFCVDFTSYLVCSFFNMKLPFFGLLVANKISSTKYKIFPSDIRHRNNVVSTKHAWQPKDSSVSRRDIQLP